MTSLRQDLHEKEEGVQGNVEVAENVEESELIQWGPLTEGKLYGYLGPLSIDAIGFENLTSDTVQNETVILAALHKGTDVIRLHQRKPYHTCQIMISSDNMFLYMGKLNDACRFPLYQVVEVRRGQKTRVFEAHRLNQGPYSHHADMSMSMVFLGKKVFNFVFNSVDECDIWWTGLSLLIEEAKQSDLVIFSLKCLFNEFHKEGLSRKLVKRMLKKIHYSTSKHQLSRLFTEADANSDGVLVFAEFLTLVKKLQRRTEIEDLFKKYTPGDSMDAEQLCNFFNTEQQEDSWTVEKCQRMINRQENGMDLPTFELMLNSPWNMLFSAYKHNEVYHDMTQPLPCYYLSSSHNTYLEHGQIRGYSATDMYIRSLKMGAKCIELDTWDGEWNGNGNGDDDGDGVGEPMIYHGHTLVSRILFVDTLRVIRDYAFIKSMYPLILSIENHCSVPQQIKMARHFKEILGDMLAEPLEEGSSLPSPQDLMGKILLKGKMMDTPVLAPGDSSETTKVRGNIAHELSSIMYLKLMPVSNLSKIHTCNPPPHEMLNFSEGTCTKLSKKSTRDILKYNQNNLCRVYTRGTRLRSTNYRPNHPWAIGCQIVAYNFQTPGTAKYIHEGMFADNGACGYILKPEPLLSDVSEYHPLGSGPVTGAKFSKFTIQVLSGRNLPVPILNMKINPFVDVQVHGTRVDCASYRTKTIHGNGLCPVWNETFEFSLRMSQLAVLVIKIGTYNDFHLHYSHIGHFSVRVENLRAGYRVVPLVNQQGYQSGVGNLLCKISLTPS